MAGMAEMTEFDRASRHAEALPCFRLAAAMRPDPECTDAVTRIEALTAG